MTPTPQMLEAIYVLICQLPPVSEWKMPKSGEIKFDIADKVFLNEQECYATYTFDAEKKTHEILVSISMNTSFEHILTSLLHECIHMRRTRRSNEWDLHDAVFKKYAKLICEEYKLPRIGF